MNRQHPGNYILFEFFGILFHNLHHTPSPPPGSNKSHHREATTILTQGALIV
jgi:hypothetical protein